MKEKEKLKLLKALITKETSVDSLTSKLEMSKEEVMGLIEELKLSGENVLTFKKQGEYYTINHGDNVLQTNKPYIIKTNEKVVKIGLLSDTRLCSCYEQLSILNDIYKKGNKYGVKDYFLVGDISEGIYRGNNSNLNETVFAHDVYSQADYIIENYPEIEGVKTHFITGEHDKTLFTKNDKTDIGKLISANRDDMVYLGQGRRKINFINEDNKKLFDMLLIHPTGRVPYTVSYKPQQFINSLRSENKVDFLVHGHWLQADAFELRETNEYSVPGVVATTPEMEIKGDQNIVGAWYLEVHLNDKNKIERIVPIFSPYYNTYEDDYKSAKALVLKKEK